MRPEQPGFRPVRGDVENPQDHVLDLAGWRTIALSPGAGDREPGGTLRAAGGGFRARGHRRATDHGSEPGQRDGDEGAGMALSPVPSAPKPEADVNSGLGLVRSLLRAQHPEFAEM